MKTNIIKRLIQVNIFISVLTLILIEGAQKFPLFVEEVYSRHIYQYSSNFIAFLGNWIPFSMAEIIIVLWVISVLWIFLMLIIGLVKRRWRQGIALFLVLITIGNTGILYYQTSWGLNNYRLNVEELFDLGSKEDISIDILANLYKELLVNANALREELDYSEYTKEFVYKNAYKGYIPLSDEYDFIDAHKVIVKPLMISSLFSTSGYTGIYLFFVSQPTVNYMPLLSDLPFTACHEIAHQKGFASEDEANFMAFMSASVHEDILFRYSAYYSALSYVGNAIYKNNKELYTELGALRSDLVMQDIYDEIDFWDSVVVERNRELHNKVNDTFLKATNQPDGILNYSKVVELLALAYIKGII